MTAKAVTSAFQLGTYDGTAMYAISPPKPPTNKPFSEWSQTTSNFGFWWIISDTTDDEALANMHVQQKRIGGELINCLVNSRAVRVNERLRCLKAATSKRALANVISTVSAKDGAPKADAQAGQKRKR